MAARIQNFIKTVKNYGSYLVTIGEMLVKFLDSCVMRASAIEIYIKLLLKWNPPEVDLSNKCYMYSFISWIKLL